MSTLTNPVTLTADEILEQYATNEHRWLGWEDREINFEVGPATAELHAAYLAFRTVYHVDHRGQGHGRRLMDVIVAYAEATGCGLDLTVLTDNEPAIHLYTSVGFKIVHTTEARYDDLGRPRPAMHYMKRYPTRIPATDEWDKHFEAKARQLERDHEPAPEGPDEWAEPREAIRAAEKVAYEHVKDRDRYSGSDNYEANTRRMYRDAFGAALLASGWTITRTGEVA
jgi:GNAT superfamily N-acetyltransferase